MCGDLPAVAGIVAQCPVVDVVDHIARTDNRHNLDLNTVANVSPAPLAPEKFPPLQVQHGDSTISTFRFNPSYLVDLIFFRHILTRVQGAYYFRPAVDYDFIRSETGRKIGAGAAVIWSRASEFIQTPGHAADLGVELDLSLYIQESTFGRLSDDPQEMGGFFGLAQFGVFFPLGGLGYQDQIAQKLVNKFGSGADELDTAWMLRAYLGVFF